MINTLRAIPEFFHNYYDFSEVYSQPQVVDLDQEFDRYSFTLHHPDEEDAIRQLFDQTVTRHSGEVVTLEQLLGSEIYEDEDGELFEKMDFRQLNPNPQGGIVLEHDLLKGWLIKKNYGWLIDEDGIKKRIAKAVGARDIPRWMLPPSQRDKPKDALLGIQLPNDVINPLRVVMLKRGRKWIKSLHLENLKAAKEYLYPLTAGMAANPKSVIPAEKWKRAERGVSGSVCDEFVAIATVEEQNEPDGTSQPAILPFLEGIADPKPLHEKVVVISKKEQILDESANLWYFAEIGQCKPSKLEEIAFQICLFITCNPLTDLHMYNIRFLDDDTDTVLFMDGEPVGGLAEASDQMLIDANQKYDRGFFSILGLRKLQLSISEGMKDEGIPESDIETVQKIFDEAIEKRVRVIDWERKWHWVKVYAMDCCLIALIISIFNKICGITLSGQGTLSPLSPPSNAIS